MEEFIDEALDPVTLVEAAAGRETRLVLAVSGGLDSMVLLHAAAAAVDAGRVEVATFDHGTGPHAARAVNAVAKECRRLRIPCVTGRSSAPGRRESEWRNERWKFLRSAAARSGASIVTAHTRDDHIETVFMRVLRDAGPRGLAGLLASSDIVRPFVGLTRSAIARYGEQHGVAYVEDPSNLSRLHLRNRVRHDLLPAIVKARPSFIAELMKISRDAAEWRRAMTVAAVNSGAETRADGSLRIARAALAGYDAEGLRALWPSLAAMSDIVMDRRGTHRLAEFTMKGHTGGSIQLSGGIEVRMLRDHMVLRRWDAGAVEALRADRNQAAARMSATLPVPH